MEGAMGPLLIGTSIGLVQPLRSHSTPVVYICRDLPSRSVESQSSGLPGTCDGDSLCSANRVFVLPLSHHRLLDS
ncbi:hypothetical protein BD310DRAFT_937810 [Dichomitus squalens]|uniref:Uncharacterized protein n=1 Tax=Dichomitus squalens TaxID=114155 RepID=A0A4Q9PF16_9APHY|nr:hypothetical protein BD310DRAFT_937810 [Dichomitus squalens]